jgi:parallel beta-helix repeat protein
MENFKFNCKAYMLKGEGMRRIAFGILLMLLLMAMFSLALNIKSTKAEWTGTVYIRADGSIDPPDAPIITYDNVTYTFTDNITSNTDGVIVQRDNVIVDGAGYTLQGTSANEYRGIDLTARSNVTIKNIRITAFYYGIKLSGSSNNSIIGNNITNNDNGIDLFASWNNSIIGNNITANNQYGIKLSGSSNNSIIRNNITAKHWDGISLYESSNNSIIGNNIANNGYGVYLRESSNNSIIGNNITNNEHGISLSGSSNNSIIGNNITNNQYGISLGGSSNNSIIGNNITNNQNGGINLVGSLNNSLVGSSNNSIIGNNIANNGYGVYLRESSNNSIIGNNITANDWYGVYLIVSSNNSIIRNSIANNRFGISLYGLSNCIYHNNFIRNTIQVDVLVGGYTNIWDDGYPSGGNYWSDYSGVDFNSGPYQNETGSDGMGDTPYVIDANNVDRYPLMAPFKVFEAQHWDGLTYNFHVISNSTILNFELFESLIPEIPSKISLNVSGPDNTNGFCRITIPNIIVQDLWQNNYMVLLNGEPYPFKNWTDSENTYIYINYTHSTHEIVIIPEYPSTIILTIFMLTTTVLAVLTRNRRLKHRR